jgi:hypothetical protein
MGKILILLKYVFLVYSADINELRKHIHVTYNVAGYKKSCKFWLEPKVELDENKKGFFSEIELREIEKLIENNKEIILQQLNLFYKGDAVKSIRINQ